MIEEEKTSFKSSEYSSMVAFIVGRGAYAIVCIIICFLSNQSAPRCITFNSETIVNSRLFDDPVMDPSLKEILALQSTNKLY